MPLPNIFRAQIAKQVNNALGKIVLQGTLRRSLRDTRIGGQLTAGLQTVDPDAPQEISYTFNGFLDAFSISQLDGNSLIRNGDTRINIFGASLPDGIVPQPNDHIDIEGQTFYIVALLDRDPAGAVYTCHGR